MSFVYGQTMMKRFVFLQSGHYTGSTGNVICCDSDHDTLNDIIFGTAIPTRWEIWEHHLMNQYELVFADTGVYPYPPGITTGNFKPYDVGDIDRDSLTDLLGPNTERALNDSTYYLVTTQESPNYTYYPTLLSWWLRISNRGPGSAYYFTPDLDRDGRKEILTSEGFYGDTVRLMLVENIGNNQNVPVWRRFTYGPSYAFGDFDQDSLCDFVTANPGSSGEIYFFENTGDNQYDRITIDTVRLPNGTDVFSGNDLDNDGKPEFFICFARYAGGPWDFYLDMWEATGNNIYQRTLIDQIRSSDWSGKKSICGDIDGDGIEELVWSIGSRVIIYKATGNNQFQRIWDWVNDHGGQLPTAKVNIYDMNNNGYKEIVVGGSGKTSIFEVEAVRLLRPNGNEIFHADSSELIHWQTFYPPRCDSLSLFYSIDNGRTYNLITHALSGNDTSYLWTVPNVNSDSCKVKIIAYGPGWQYDESDGIFSITSTGIEETSMLNALCLTLKVERRINPATTIFSIPTFQRVNLKLYDINGRLIEDLVNETKEPGIYKINLNTKGLSAGVYFLCLQTEDKRIIERIIIVK
jgi:hypothetical protein